MNLSAGTIGLLAAALLAGAISGMLPNSLAKMALQLVSAICAAIVGWRLIQTASHRDGNEQVAKERLAWDFYAALYVIGGLIVAAGLFNVTRPVLRRGGFEDPGFWITSGIVLVAIGLPLILIGWVRGKR